ncbi:MAG: hypothetical protein ACFE8E_01860 [Candidatus Hodarchaeota archaeon]
MKTSIKCLISFFFLGFLIFTGIYTPISMAQDGPPSPEDAFGGHTFDENYWDINIFNNSHWDHPEVDDMRSWLNNTWNVKWIKEGNFEMGMLAFLNHTHKEGGVDVTYITPAQMWWQHAYLWGSEIWIASMHCAWFGFADQNNNDAYDEALDEEINPFFYMGTNSPRLRNDVGIYSNPKTIAKPLQRSVSGSIITYNWGYNYSDIVFYVPKTNRTMAVAPLGRGFDWGFNYSDPGTYIDGSQVIGNQTYVYYEYTLEVDTAAGEATLYQDYETGDFGVLMYRENLTDTWHQAFEGDQGYMPQYWAMCLGTWSFIYADQDWALTDLLEGEINATVHKTGLTEVRTTLGGLHAFDFAFSQKPTYHLTHINGTDLGDRDALYECLDVNADEEFISFVSGMLPLVGDFGRLIACYAINQTNHFTYGIPFDDVWTGLQPNETAAFFITCYPDYGEGAGGKLSHDPVFKAYFSIGEGEIPGYPIFLLGFTLMIGITILISKKRLKLKINSKH